ncbi:MAG: aldehyde dehydrogenase family protein [Deltaproteobacteria bacterium]|nr:aldehyde dehydrogenase family protein [Deltaproteobacteria bacterium]
MPQLDVLSPYDEKTIKSFELIDEDQALEVLEQCHQLYLEREAWLPAPRRIEILERAAVLVASRADSLAMQAAREGGKPLTDSKVEIRRAVEGIKVAAREIWQLGGSEVPMRMTASSMNRIAYTFREPCGVVLAISAFNHPFNLLIHQVVTAVAAGCPVIIKPALTTPMSCESLVNILYEAGLPRPWCQMVLCDDQVSERLVTDSRVSFLSFIGSARVGWYLRSKLAPGARCALEHGGLAPAIVDRTADLDDAVPLLVKGGFYHAGQVCVSVQRIYVEEAIVEQFTTRFVEQARQLEVGDPTDLATEVGPLILPREVDRVHAWVQEAVERGGRLLCGGKKISSTSYEPTVILDPPDDVKLSCEEIFGPVVAIYPFSDRREAIRRANAPDAYFQASVFTRELDVALETSRKLNGMAVMINDHPAFRVDWMPFGGHRQSGMGVGGIAYTMRDITLERMVVFRSNQDVPSRP